MMNRRKLLILGLFLAMMFIHVAPVNAHTPGPMTLDYDFGTQVLSVTISHSVADVNTHYIIQVVVEKNSVEVLTKDYTNQNTTSTFSATYALPATHGDVLSVTAICSVSGQATDEVTVVDPAVTTTTTPPPNGGTPMDMTLIIAGAVITIGVIAVVFAVMRRR
jgi:hypothetical protein